MNPQGPADETRANAKLMARYYDEVFNHRNLAFLRAHLHPEVVGHGPGVDDVVRGVDAVVAFSACVWQVYDDYRLTVDEIVAASCAGGVAAAASAARGTRAPHP